MPTFNVEIFKNFCKANLAIFVDFSGVGGQGHRFGGYLSAYPLARRSSFRPVYI